MGAESCNFLVSPGDKLEDKARLVEVGAVDTGLALHPGKVVLGAGPAGSKDWKDLLTLLAWSPQNKDLCIWRPGNLGHG